ncbi:hypothetical protein ACFQX8_02590 [Klenkia terrae]|uniref:hypothetical protein n=1 Tax=Klenkia terrae TaxID=1052259 RepID=UPI0036096B75
MVVVLLAAAGWLAVAAPALADTAVVVAFPADPSSAEDALSCLPTNPFCVIGEAAGAVVADVWISAMLSLWEAGLWLLGLAFSVIDALATPDLSAGGPLAGVYPVTFGIGAAVAALMAMVQLGVAAARRDGQSLGRLLIGLLQFGLVWVSYVGIAALLVTGVSGLITALLRSLLDIDTLAAFDPSISVGRDVVNGTVATVLGVSSIFLLVPASVGYLLLMLVREAALIVLAATSAISAGGLLAQSSSAWFWRSLRWFLAALLVAPVAVLILGVGVTITEGIVTGAEETSTEAAVGMAVVGCLLILLGAICPLALFRLLAFVDPGTSSGAALRSSLAASGGVMGALGNLGGEVVVLRGPPLSPPPVGLRPPEPRQSWLETARRGVDRRRRDQWSLRRRAACADNGHLHGRPSGRWGGRLGGRRPLRSWHRTHRALLQAVSSGPGFRGGKRARSRNRALTTGRRVAASGRGRPRPLTPDPLWSSLADGAAAVGWPAERANGAGRGGSPQSDLPAPRGRPDSPADDGAA